MDLRHTLFLYLFILFVEDQQADGSHQSHRYTDKSREMITQGECKQSKKANC